MALAAEHGHEGVVRLLLSRNNVDADQVKYPPTLLLVDLIWIARSVLSSPPIHPVHHSSRSFQNPAAALFSWQLLWDTASLVSVVPAWVCPFRHEAVFLN